MEQDHLQYIKPEYHNRLDPVEMERQLANVRSKLSKWADKIVVGGFYEKVPEVKREIGETWNDSNGEEWTVDESGNKCTTKSLLLKSLRLPHWCPKCGKVMDHRIHERMWYKRGTCHRCVTAYEHRMRIDGVWPAYERRQLRANERAWLKDQIVGHLAFVNEFKNPQLHFQDGRWEEIAQKDQFSVAFAKVLEDVVFMESRIEQLEKEEKDDKSEQRKLTNWIARNPWTTTPEPTESQSV